MQCRIRDFRCKEVINVCDGCRLGYVSDLDVRVPEGQVVAIIVYGPGRFFGLFGRGEEFYIPWECIQRIGDDIILIDKPFPPLGLSRDNTAKKTADFPGKPQKIPCKQL